MKIPIEIIKANLDTAQENSNRVKRAQMTNEMIIAEMQGEQAAKDKVADHRTITAIDEEVIPKVFYCWSILSSFREWVEMLKAQVKNSQPAKTKKKLVTA